MDKREGTKGRSRPEFCASCSKAMISYITTVRDFLDKVVEDIDVNTPSSRREEGVLARTRITAEASSQRDQTDGRKRSVSRGTRTLLSPPKQPQTDKQNVRDQRKGYEPQDKIDAPKKEAYVPHEPQSAIENRLAEYVDVQSSEVTSSVPLRIDHEVRPLQDGPILPSSVPREQSPERTPGHRPDDSPPIDESRISQPSTDSAISLPQPAPTAVPQPSPTEPTGPSEHTVTHAEQPSPVQHPQREEEKFQPYVHPPPLYSDHLAPPVQPEQTSLPLEEPSLADEGPFPSTWVEDMIRVCDIPLLLPPSDEREAYVTMATNNLTAIGCLVLGNSLRLTGTKRTLVVLITDDVTEELRNLLASVFHVVQPISLLEPTGSTKLALLEQPELGINYSKLLVWRLNQFDKCVFLSPDTLVVQNCDELFQRNELSAVPDIGWPDFFNAGVFVYVPSDATFWDLVSCAENKGSFDGGDQGLLNYYFRSWLLDINKRLPFIFNLMANVSYTYGPAFVRFGGNAKIIHFFGTTKPWNVQFNVRTGQLAPYSGVHPTFSRYVQYWLTIFAQCVLPLFSSDIQGFTTMHGYVNAVDLARIVTGHAESAITFSPPSFRRYLDVPETVAFPAEKVQSVLLRRLSVDEEPPSEEEEEEEEEDIIEEEKKAEDKEAEALADFNRRQAWEQGRIDYMGQDSSDNIMKRLDRFIRKGSKLS